MSSIPVFSENLETSFTIDDGNKDDDDDLITPCFKVNTLPHEKKENKLDDYLSKIENEAFEEYKVMIDDHANKIYSNQKVELFDYYTVYFHCPICMKSGFKTIEHIKICASKSWINPKEVIYLLRQCPKTRKQKFIGQKGKATTKQRIKKDKIKVNKEYVIEIVNDEFKREQIEKRVRQILASDQKKIVYEVVEDFSPIFWKISSLTYDSNKYIIEEFSKYFDKRSPD